MQFGEPLVDMAWYLNQSNIYFLLPKFNFRSLTHILSYMITRNLVARDIFWLSCSKCSVTEILLNEVQIYPGFLAHSGPV